MATTKNGTGNRKKRISISYECHQSESLNKKAQTSMPDTLCVVATCKIDLRVLSTATTGVNEQTTHQSDQLWRIRWAAVRLRALRSWRNRRRACRWDREGRLRREVIQVGRTRWAARLRSLARISWARGSAERPEARS